MDLLSVFKRGSAGPASVDTPPSLDSVATARRRARQRLIGATVLVVIAVVAFPMVFDATPRPVSVDVPIVIPRKDGSPPLAMPGNGTSPELAPPVIASSAPAAVVASNGPAASTAPPAAGASGSGVVITEGKDDAGTEVKAPVPDARVAMGQPGPPHSAKPVKPVPKPADKPAEKPVEKPADKPVVAKAEPARPAPDDASRAKALLENKPVAKADPAPAAKPSTPAAAGDTRFVVQVAAFSSEAPVQEMRSKLDKAGVKSFSQAVDTPQGKRYRVRVGPFNSRDEAEHAAAKIKSAGLSSSIIPL